MIGSERVLLSAVIVLWIASASLSMAQQMAAIETPLQNSSDSFYENIGTSWSYERDNFRFSFGGNAIPPFGGFDPNAGANLGFRVNDRKGGQFRFNLSMGQGSNRSNSVTSPSIVVPNGGSGFINNTMNRPFVTSVIPVIGGGVAVGGNGPIFSPYPSFQPGQSFSMNPGAQPVSVSPLIEKMRRLGAEPPRESSQTAAAPAQANEPERSPPSSAEFGDVSVAEITAQQESVDVVAMKRLAEHIEKAEKYQAAGKYNVARYHFQNALKRAAAKDQPHLQERLNQVDRLIYQQKQAARLARSKESE